MSLIIGNSESIALEGPLMTSTELFEQAKLLPARERELLATLLLQSLDAESDAGVSLDAEDEAELQRRLELVRTGQAKGHDLETVMDGLRAILRKKSVA